MRPSRLETREIGVEESAAGCADRDSYLTRAGAKGSVRLCTRVKAGQGNVAADLTAMASTASSARSGKRPLEQRMVQETEAECSSAAAPRPIPPNPRQRTQLH